MAQRSFSRVVVVCCFVLSDYSGMVGSIYEPLQRFGTFYHKFLSFSAYTNCFFMGDVFKEFDCLFIREENFRSL